ncbi:MAG: DNA polymerase III subunit gamma/tau [Pseudomonadota bacterium]
MVETGIAEHQDGSMPYQVLARKYRPQSFDDLIGHGAMVQTLKNAFATGRIAHAFVLTGVRGVGKTTTARILARALNYVSVSGGDNGPSIDTPEEGLHCRAIAESRHPDVMEMDAASRTGVGDIRELIEGVRYAPVEARYKVYIIDEVHMLSTAAFNALLKTLEEPPAHVKFIFATTEIRKLPVTVLSRCQRFDLRRIDDNTLTEHLAQIAKKEGSDIDTEGLAMIARAAEGSVRDALSILDQALLQHAATESSDESLPISAEAVRSMLGLADRTQVWDLIDAALSGDGAKSLSAFRTQYDAGADPAAVIRDMLEVLHLATRVKAAGPEAASHGAAGEADAARAMATAEAFPMNALTRAWGLLMKGLSETQLAPDAAAAAEMALIRLVYAADLPTPDEALRMLKASGSAGTAGQQAGSSQTSSAQTSSSHTSSGQAGNSSTPGTQMSGQGMRVVEGGGSAAQATMRQAQFVGDPVPDLNTVQQVEQAPKIIVRSLADVARLAEEKRDAKFRVELESYVHVISFEQGRIELRLAPNAPTDLSGRLVQRLKQWTGQPWTVTIDTEKTGAETLRDARLREVMDDPLVKAAFDLFPGIEIRAIRDQFIEGPTTDPDVDINSEDDHAKESMDEKG